MRKRTLILIGVVILLVVGILLVFFLNKSKEEVLTSLFIDVNPSVEIKMNEEQIVREVIPVNEDAKGIVSEDLKDKPVKDVVTTITNKIIEGDYIEDERVEILLYSNGNIVLDEIGRDMAEVFRGKDLDATYHIIEKVTKEDEELAKQYGISVSKAAYINSVVKSNDNVPIESLINRNISEITNTKESGWYCEEGYRLDGSRCLKEISRADAKGGEVCPRAYYEYKGTCYEERGMEETGKLLCGDGFTLEGEKCVRHIEQKVVAEGYSCKTGTLMKRHDVGLRSNGKNDDYVCADLTNASAPKLRCLYNSGHIMIDGKCYNGPAPLINGGCPGNDIVRNGFCYSKDDEDQWQCPNGEIYQKSKNEIPQYCAESYTEAEVTGYKCENENARLDGNKCYIDEEQPAERERKCHDGYNLVDGNRCINLSDSKDKIDGYICEDPNTILMGKYCVTYKEIEARK